MSIQDEDKNIFSLDGLEDRKVVEKDEKFCNVRGEIKATNDAINEQDVSRPTPPVIREKQELEGRQIDLTEESNEIIEEKE